MNGNQQLALALPNQVSSQPSRPTRPVEHHQQPMPQHPSMPPQSLTPSQGYYLPPAQLSNLPPQVQVQSSQAQYVPPDPQYRTPPQPTHVQFNQTSQNHSLHQYQQQWSQQLPVQGHMPQQHTPLQPQVRPASPAVYASYTASQSNPSMAENHRNSMPMQMPFSGISQPVPNHAEAMAYGYSGVNRSVQPQPAPQHLKANFGAQPADGYAASGPQQPTLSPGNPYMMYDSDRSRAQHLPQPHFQQSGGYSQNQQPTANSNVMVRPPQLARSHPYNELIEKLVSMGYRGDHAATVIQRLEESGQPVDFNAVLDRLNVHSSGGSQRGWSL